jgi:hypothetical protein
MGRSNPQMQRDQRQVGIGNLVRDQRQGVTGNLGGNQRQMLPGNQGGERRQDVTGNPSGGTSDEIVRREKAATMNQGPPKVIITGDTSNSVGEVSLILGDEGASLDKEVDLGDKDLEPTMMVITKNTGKEKVQENNGDQGSSGLTIQEKSGQEAKGKKPVCQRCKEEGHLAVDCNKN